MREVLPYVFSLRPQKTYKHKLTNNMERWRGSDRCVETGSNCIPARPVPDAVSAALSATSLRAPHAQPHSNSGTHRCSIALLHRETGLSTPVPLAAPSHK
ncbi:hypothetical protein Y023_5129 [Burkholderia pseudomallei A79D]|nr:hypothetical protein X942_5267 [Burkholderia pseudomallei MSHR5596]KGX96328.1 hypothetical protein Y023_5129 [Burkholderia pseudomallei A79D]KGX97313.1 hypothetical protein X997_4812 [Burkholderia pseudomallei A79C]